MLVRVYVVNLLIVVRMRILVFVVYLAAPTTRKPRNNAPLSLQTRIQSTKMAKLVNFDKVLKVVNGESLAEDSDWEDTDDDLFNDDQVGLQESFHRPHASEDPLQRFELETHVEDQVDETSHTPLPAQENTSINSDIANMQESNTPEEIDSQVGSHPQTSTCTTFEPPTLLQPSASHTMPVSLSISSATDPFQFIPGPTPIIQDTLDGSSHPYEFFCKIWGDDTFQHIADQSNLYAQQKQTAEWVTTSEKEVQSLVVIQLVMGIVRLPSMYDYWNTNPLLNTPGITLGMSRHRFRSLLSHLHLNDNSAAPDRSSPQFDKLYKVRPLLEHIRNNSQICYQLHQKLLVDEAIILFKG